MNINSAGQTTGKQKIKEKEAAKIRYSLLGLKIDPDQKARGKLRMPANVAAFYGPPTAEDPLVVLDVRDSSDIPCVTLMRDCLHENVLHARILMERDPYLLVLVENYTGLLSTYLRTIEAHIPDSQQMSDPHMMPSLTLQLIVTHMIDGLLALFKHGKCHGNLKLENTCYIKTRNGDIITKLTGFKDRKVSATKPVSHYQAEDIRSVGHGLTEITEIAEDFNKQGYSLDCFQIEHLAQRLKTVSPGDLYITIEEIRTYPFFWTEVERSFFFVSEVPLALHHKLVRSSIEKEQDLCDLPWNCKHYNGFLQLMIDYRRNKKLPAYNFDSRVDYVQFISGLYTHQSQLTNPYGNVDTTVKSTNPRLYAILYSLLPRGPRRPIRQD
ncbi:uncharacterized protein [Lolium perenne]|uniref:uncharacterized protein n=1 Tax=Lolium perenne TaxID=4522 RepID=UPI0021F574C5|nr:uncharacterized protein LOC127336348 [Lolium perenne]XP_051219116.1 uncharacterized protein LOC127336348 [Lolium perenne]